MVKKKTKNKTPRKSQRKTRSSQMLTYPSEAEENEENVVIIGRKAEEVNVKVWYRLIDTLTHKSCCGSRLLHYVHLTGVFPM